MISLENTENFWVMVLVETKCLGNTAQNEAQTNGKKWAERNVDLFPNSGSSIGEPQVQLRLQCGPGDTYETGVRVGQLGADAAV